jgi:hypothetical protein
MPLLTDQPPVEERVVDPPRGLWGKFLAWRR